MQHSDQVTVRLAQLPLQLREEGGLDPTHSSDVIGPLAAALQHAQHRGGRNEWRALVFG